MHGTLGYLHTAQRQSATKTIEAHGLSYYNRRDWFPCTVVRSWSLLLTPATEHSEVT
jgi:hypothetical protein